MYKPGSVPFRVATIYLRRSVTESFTQPTCGLSDEQSCRDLVLLLTRFTVSSRYRLEGELLPHRFTLTPLLNRFRRFSSGAVCFLWHFLSRRRRTFVRARVLPGVMFYGARTFLRRIYPGGRHIRPSSFYSIDLFFFVINIRKVSKTSCIVFMKKHRFFFAFFVEKDSAAIWAESYLLSHANLVLELRR